MSAAGRLHVEGSGHDHCEIPLGPLPECVGSYRILGVLGAGGMGVVYEAEQRQPRRRVALKVVRGGHVVDEAHARLFHREAELLARLKHPNIAAIYESGHTEDGHDFFAMELATGVTLDQWLGLSAASFSHDELALRLRVFDSICEAVHYAHQRGVIHLDLKPSNIMISEEAGEPLGRPAAHRHPTVKILDFGLARVRETNVEAASPDSDPGGIRGTLAYMAPEQARGDIDAVDVRADVYALGVILYEMLSGQRPYSLSGLGMLDALRLICEEPPRPLRQFWAGARPPDADLATVVFTAVDKDPERRYPSVAALGEDVRRYLRTEPLEARPRSTGYRFRKFVQRHRLGVGVAAVLSLLLVAFGTVMSVMYSRSERLRQQLVVAGIEAGRSLRLAEQERDRARWSEYFAEMTLAGQAAVSTEGLSRTSELLGEWYPQVAGSDLRGWEWFYLQALCHRDLATASCNRGRVRSVAWSPDGGRIAAANEDGSVALWGAELAGEARILSGHDGRVGVVAFSPDGLRLVSAGDDGRVVLWDAATGRVLGSVEVAGGRTGSLSFAPDGESLASQSLDGALQVWDLAGSQLRTLVTSGDPEGSAAVAWSPVGSVLASAGPGEVVAVRDARSGAVLREIPVRCSPVALSWSPDGSRLAVSCYDQRLEVWDVAAAVRRLSLSGPTDLVYSLAWSHDGTRLATAGFDHVVRLWDAASGRELASFGGHVGRVFGIDWSPDDRRLVSSGEDATLKLWDAGAETGTARFDGHHDSVLAVDYSPDGLRAASLDASGFALIWTVADRRVELRLEGLAHSLIWGADGTTLVTFARDGRVQIREAATGRVATSFEAPQGMWAAPSPDGARVATAGADGVVRVFSVPDGAQRLAMTGHHQIVNQVAWDPDGGRLVSVANDRAVRVWDATTGAQLAEMAHDNYATAVTWSPDGRLVASGGNDRTIRIWDAATGELVTLLRGHSNGIGSLAWSPDGTRLASACVDRTVKIWDPINGHEALTLADSSGWVTAVSWSPDGRALIASGREPSVRIYDASRGYALER